MVIINWILGLTILAIFSGITFNHVDPWLGITVFFGGAWLITSYLVKKIKGNNKWI